MNIYSYFALYIAFQALVTFALEITRPPHHTHRPRLWEPWAVLLWPVTVVLYALVLVGKLGAWVGRAFS